ncbi:hypothetical protein [Phycicoccus sp. Root563]|uniref:hypothetical protein n=1 Tax=Phycicoccus sp. Root563 TaxID=1736562 RepID=UPI0012FB8DAC|nr:hypothetical protein [Phycicoccus sp. Root563]
MKYHENQLASLQERVRAALERFRTGELDAFEVDQVLFQYSRAAKERGSSATLAIPSSLRTSCVSVR